MSFSKDFGLGIKTYGKALDIIFSNGLAWFFIFPIVINIILFWSGIEVLDWITTYLKNLIFDSSGLNNAAFFGSSVLKFLTSGIIWLLFKIIFFFLFTYIGGYLVLILMSPILAIISEKTDKILTGKNYPFSAEQTMRDMVRGIILAIRNMSIEIGIILFFFILTLLPIIGWLIAIISPIILFFISSYFYGFSFLDYSNERYKRNIKQSVTLIYSRKGVAIGNGVVFSIFLLVPFLGTTLAGFISIISVVAATISMNEVE
jgi:CysZ protein